MSACGGSEDIGSDNPAISRDFISVSPSMQLLGDGQVSDLTIESNCEWSISKSEEWLTVTPMSGKNKQIVTVSAGKNSTGAERTAILTITGGTAPSRSVLITQAKANETPVAKTLSVNPNSLSFEAEEETKSFDIYSNTNWNISCPDWCFLSVQNGSGNATIAITAMTNAETVQRNGQVIITGIGVTSVSINITQKAKEEDNSQKEPGADDNLPPT